MKIFVLGATGKTGTQLLDLALRGGHEVTAFVRSAQKLAQARQSLSVAQGSPADTESMAKAMAGHDAVFNCLAPGIGEILSRPGKRTWTMESYARQIVQAMGQAGVRRYLGFSSAGLFPGQSLFVRLLSFPARHHMADLAAMESVIKESNLEWTLARPTWMAKGESDAYRAQAGAMLADAKPMHFRGLAQFMLDSARLGKHLREVVSLAR